MMEKLCRLLAAEYNALPSDLTRRENVLTVSASGEGGWRYQTEPYFFRMVTLGGNAVITADEALHPFLRSFIEERTGHYLFELPNLLPLEDALNAFGYTLMQSVHWFLEKHEVNPRKNLHVRRFSGAQAQAFCADERFPNLIANPPADTVICAYDGENIMGAVGTSEDAAGWYQIGVDVMPAYRGRGIGTELVSLMKEDIRSRGGIPFYATSVSNLVSWNLALSAGFRPYWVEIGAKKYDKGESQWWQKDL